MVVDVQERQLAERFSQDEEPCVQELHELLQVEHGKEMTEVLVEAGALADVCLRFVAYEQEITAEEDMYDANGHIARNTHHAKIV